MLSEQVDWLIAASDSDWQCGQWRNFVITEKIVFAGREAEIGGNKCDIFVFVVGIVNVLQLAGF